MMKPSRVDIQRFIVAVLLTAAATAIASLTIGRDIYYGTRGEGIFSFAIVSLAGYLFFLFIPVELAFIYYLTAGENFILLNAVALGTDRKSVV